MRIAMPPRAGDDELFGISASTIAHYRRMATAYREATWHHDVRQNIAALLGAIEGEPPFCILDLGCGPGRDLIAFRELGHEPIGLDGCPEFVEMARAASGCEVWLQDLLALDLPAERFDGIFANAVLFHVPSRALPKVLADLWQALGPGGVLFSSNPHGHNEEGLAGERYACFCDPATWRGLVENAGFVLVDQYFRPAGKPRRLQPWLATVWRKAGAEVGGAQ
jgi:SAM-dependent methyltransferase